MTATQLERDADVWRLIMFWRLRYWFRFAVLIAVLLGALAGWYWGRTGNQTAIIFRFDARRGLYWTRDGEASIPHVGVTSNDVRVTWPSPRAPWQVTLDLHEDANAETQYIEIPIQEQLTENPVLYFRYTLIGAPVTAEFQVCDEKGSPLTTLSGSERHRLNSIALVPAASPKVVDIALQGYSAGETRAIKILFRDEGRRSLDLLSLGIASAALVEQLAPADTVAAADTSTADQIAKSNDAVTPDGSVWRKFSPLQQRLLSDLEERHLRFFLDRRDPVSGLVPDRAPPWKESPLDDRHRLYSVGGMGFAFACWVRAEELGMIRQGTAQQWAQQALATLDRAPRQRGLLPHFVTATGQAALHSEFSTIDHGLLIAGLVALQSYCDNPPELKAPIERMLDVAWPELIVEKNGARLLCMGTDADGQLLNSCWDNYNEGILIYALSAGSSQQPISARVFEELARNEFPATRFVGDDQFAGQTLPLFVHQYPALFWGTDVDLRLPSGLDVADNSRKATLFNRRFCRSQDFASFKSGFWGVTACDAPNGSYYGYRPLVGDSPGVVCPSAILASAPFAPEVVAADLEAWEQQSEIYSRILGDYGFCDSFMIQDDGTIVTSDDAIAITVGAAVLGIAQVRGGGTDRWFRTSTEGRRSVRVMRDHEG